MDSGPTIVSVQPHRALTDEPSRSLSRWTKEVVFLAISNSLWVDGAQHPDGGVLHPVAATRLHATVRSDGRSGPLMQPDGGLVGNADSVTTKVWTDGACIGNPGPGGWAWAVPDVAFASGAEADSTNQRMEVMAALSALHAITGTVEIVTDSKYVADCFNQSWWVGWEKRGWRNANKQPVANQDLWQPFIKLYKARQGEVTFSWVKGHSGDAMNDVVDRLATEAAATQVGRSGDKTPTDLGPADVPVRRAVKAVPGAEPPSGHRVVVLGHRPPDLGGYEANPISEGVLRRLTETLAGLKAVHPDLVVLTGLGLGAEQLGAEAASAAGVPYIAVQAFPEFEGKWPIQSQMTFRRLLAGATSSVTVSKTRPTSKQAAGMALGSRDRWLIEHADGALVVWDGEDRSLGYNVTALEQRIPDEVWVIAPEP
jgi:ribonuclease HI/uncharacterized phage-like protein YoqJ